MINICMVERTRLRSKEDIDLNLTSSTFLLLQNFNNLYNFLQPQFIQLKNRFNNACLAELLEGLTIIYVNPLTWHLSTQRKLKEFLLLLIFAPLSSYFGLLIYPKLCCTCHLNS